MPTKTVAKPRTTTRKPRAAKPAAKPKTEVVLEDIALVTETVDPVTILPQYILPEDPIQRQALVESYWALKKAEFPIPDSIRIPVEDWINDLNTQDNSEQTQAIQAEEDRINQLNETGPTYVRNCTNNPFNFRLDRQQEGPNRQRRIELKPRGVPGDLHPLKEEDLLDPGLIANLNLGLVELVPAGYANEIQNKQTTNMSVRVHPAFAILAKEAETLNRNGVPTAINPGVKIEAEYNSQGITVATIDPRVSGQMTDTQLKNAGGFAGGLTRGDAPIQSAYVPTGGHPASISIDPLAHSRIQDDIARRKGLSGPEAALGQVTVRVEPTQKYNG